jgi:mRNA-degrading endonuclease toxin of MazEF toxin-antitoxin module
MTTDQVNAWRRTVVVIPLSNTKANPPLSVVVRSQGKTSVAAIDQIRAATKERFVNKIGVASSVEMTAIEDALREVLDL